MVRRARPLLPTLAWFRFVAGAYERRALAIGSHWPFDQWGRFLPEHTTAVSVERLTAHASLPVSRAPARPPSAMATACRTPSRLHVRRP